MKHQLHVIGLASPPLEWCEWHVIEQQLCNRPICHCCHLKFGCLVTTAPTHGTCVRTPEYWLLLLRQGCVLLLQQLLLLLGGQGSARAAPRYRYAAR